MTPQGTIPSVPQQVALYLQSVGHKADPNALYIIEGGGNDILNATSGSPSNWVLKLPLESARVSYCSARPEPRHFLIPNLFNVSLCLLQPAIPRLQPRRQMPRINRSTIYWRWKVFSKAFACSPRCLQPGKCSRHRPHPLRIYQHRGALYGLPSALNPTPAICADPDHTFFWDIEHPTEFGHAFFAVTVENTLATQAW